MHKCRFPITTAEEMHGELKEKLCKMPKTESSPAIWLDHQMTLDERGLISVLALAAKLGVLDQIPGGATAEQLSRCPDVPKHFMADPISPLHYAAIHGHLDQVTGGATWQQLANVKSLRSKVTALHCAASFQHLDQIRGAVTMQDLQATLDKKGSSALEEARRSDEFSRNEAFARISMAVQTAKH